MAWSCNRPDAPDCFQQAGDDATEERDFAPGSFDTIEVSDHLHLELMPANENEAPSCAVTGPANLLPEIVTAVEDGVLWIRNDNTCNWVRRFDRPITITIRSNVVRIVNRGTGDIRTREPLGSLTLENRAASGIIHLSFANEEGEGFVKIEDHTGVADVTLTGQAHEVDLFNQGLGALDARGLLAARALVNNNSINTLSFSADQYAFIALNNRGNVRVFGAPEFVDTAVSGEGSIVFEE